ncbi:BTAD domain-containing putative transcriptional regulator [Nonomuraea rubra]|uniref:Putative ATPase n=1 Tax=Nonomuraea rubra TaxID=46180 RepID=A0A7X0TVY1_9ACTN|nr:BTAD domain-containing putative transcriptional regulator [Nonomuraea rubra]MBB6545836.1 putative ATPase [Nonomuraea rubra]
MWFGVLGPLMVRDDEGRPIKVPEVKVRALLADLLVNEGRPVGADRLIEDLWGAEPPGNPANALQAKVSQLRRAVGRDRVAYQAPGYVLRLGPADQVDADRFRALAAGARSADPATRAALLAEALELWRGPAYADFADEEFVRAAVHRLAEQRLAVVEEQAELRLAAGDHLLLAGELADLVARHPLRERLRAVQLRALYLAGRQGEALASYEELRHRLADEFGADPGPELAELHQAILRQDAPDRPRANLPAQLTTLIGRRHALEEIDRLLAGARLVTLIGPGGVGKTRVAVEAAARAGGSRFPDGVWLVEFAGQRGGVADLAQAVAATLGVSGDVPAGPGTPADRLAAALRERRILLVLDNCEQVVEPAAELVDLLLRAAPGARVLATSREPLGLAGETLFPVEPLRPDDAIRLFTERATASAPSFTLDGEIREAVAEICHRLDGIPLALELAATRVRGLGVRELAARLKDRFRVLTAGQRGAPARQQTLRAVIDWSWELLGEQERIVLRRLAGFAGGCTLDAAEAVCAGAGLPREEVLDLVTRLVDRSLVVMADSPAGPRYRLLESVAAYAMERLREADELAGVRERHLRHYLDLAEQAEPQLRGARQQAWLGRLDAEAANFRSALQEAVLPDAAARLATALCWWWLLRGRLNEGRRVLSAVLDAVPEAAELRALSAVLGLGAAELRVLEGAFMLLTGDRSRPKPPSHEEITDPVRRGRALWLHAYGLFHAGLPDACEEVSAQALGLLATDDWGTAAVLGLRAMNALARGDLDTVTRDGLRGAALFRELGDRWGELQTVSPLATLAEIKGDYPEAARRQTEGLRIAEELGLAAEVAARLSGLGRLALLSHDWDRARDLHERALRLAVEQGYVYGEVHAVMGLALGARRSGDLDAAEAHLARLRDELVSSPAGEHLLLVELGFTAELRGDAARAADCQLRGLEVARSIGEPRAVALSFEGLAGAVALSGDAGRAGSAVLLLGAADAARRSVGAPLPPAERGDVDRITAVTRALLGEDAHAEAFLRGARLGVQEAASLARSLLPDVS